MFQRRKINQEKTKVKNEKKFSMMKNLLKMKKKKTIAIIKRMMI